MAKNETQRLRPGQLSEDKNAFSALQSISGYTPANAAFTVTAGTVKLNALHDLQAAEAQAEAALKAARDNAVAAEWDLHNFILGAKIQVAAQYGANSNEIQALGLKKKTEYKSPGKKRSAAQKAKS